MRALMSPIRCLAVRRTLGHPVPRKAGRAAGTCLGLLRSLQKGPRFQVRHRAFRHAPEPSLPHPPLRRRAKGSWDKRNAGAPCKRHGRTTAPPPSSENVWSLFRRRTSDMMTLMGKTGVGSARRRFRQRGAALAPCHSTGVHRHRHPICAPSSEDLRRRGSPPADGRAAANAAL